MAAFFETEELRDRFIIAGINEIEEHGSENFSLRRIANICGVSCAAPYKHFKNKEGFMVEILDFLVRQWKLLEEQIITAYKGDLKKLIVELAVANIRFRIANPNLRFLFSLNKDSFVEEKKKELEKMNGRLQQIITEYFTEKGLSELEIKEKILFINGYIYGIAYMDGCHDNDEETFYIIRKRIEKELI